MEVEEIIENLEDQAQDKDRLAGGDPDSTFTKEADALMEAVKLLRLAYLDSKWISVKDGLPNRNQRVLVYRPAMKSADVGPVSVQWGWGCYGEQLDITHWMPLPKPPEEEMK